MGVSPQGRSPFQTMRGRRPRGRDAPDAPAGLPRIQANVGQLVIDQRGQRGDPGHDNAGEAKEPQQRGYHDGLSPDG